MRGLADGRRHLWLLAGLLIFMLPIVLLVWYVAQRHAEADAALAQLEPRYARLQGLVVQHEAIETARDQAQALRAQYLYPAAQDSTQTGNMAQQRMRELLGAAGMQVRSSQVLPPKEDRDFDRIGLTVTAEGNLVALQSVLAVLSSQVPVVLLNDLDVQVIGGLGNHRPTEAPRLIAQFSLAVLRERP